MGISSSSLTGYTDRLFGVSHTTLVEDSLSGGRDIIPANLTCFMPLTSNLELLRGIGSATFTRSTTGTFVEPNTGIVRTASTNVARFENNGVLIEGSSTNQALHSRDFTNAVHVKTNITAVKDATGADGVSNSASTLTATSANGTAFQTISLGSAEYTFSIDVRRKTGTGTIQITDEGGFTLTDITTLINSNSYTRHTITTTQINPSIGVIIVTSGDEIEVDYEGLETLPIATSRIETAGSTVTRNPDNLSINSDNIVGPTADWTMGVDFDVIGNVSGSSQRILSVEGESVRLATASFTDGTIVFRSNNTGVNPSTSASTPGVLTSYFGIKSGAVQSLVVDGVFTNGTVTLDPTGTKTSIAIGSAASGAYLYGHLKNLRLYDVALTANQI